MNGGHFTWSNSDVYIGDFRNGEISGGGRKWSGGSGGTDFYEGEFLGGLAHGSGRKVLSCGDVYEGQHSRGKRNGYGGRSGRIGSDV